MTPEIMTRKNFDYFEIFGAKNTSVKGLIFDSAPLFSQATKRNLVEQQNQELTEITIKILECLEGDHVIDLKFTNNLLTDTILRNISQQFFVIQNLQVLEITYNEIGDESLTELANIFSQN